MNLLPTSSSHLLAAAGLALAAATAIAQVEPSRPDYLPPPATGLPGGALEDDPAVRKPFTGLTQGNIEEQYRAVDTNRDGRISLDEFTAAGVPAGSTVIARSDGTIKDTRPRNTPEAFDQLDTNRDGYLSSAEYGAFTAGVKR